MDIDASLRDAPVLDRDGYAYLVHPLTDGVPRCDPGLLRAWTGWALGSPLVQSATVLLAPEAMAIPLGVALSLASDVPLLTVRKRRYGLPGEVEVPSQTGYGNSTLYLNDLRPRDRVLVVDDVLSTGGTLEAVLDALDGMDVDVLGALVFLDKGDVRKGIEKRHGVPVQVMRTVRVEHGMVTPTPGE